MLTKATVLKTEGEIATVQVERSSACEGCHKNESGEGCSVCSLTGGNKKFSAKALNRIGARVGDKVEITTDSSRVLFYSALVFLLPVVVGIAFYFASRLVSESIFVRYGALALGFVLALTVVGLYSKAVGKKRFDIEIVRVIEQGNDAA